MSTHEAALSFEDVMQSETEKDDLAFIKQAGEKEESLFNNVLTKLGESKLLRPAMITLATVTTMAASRILSQLGKEVPYQSYAPEFSGNISTAEPKKEQAPSGKIQAAIDRFYSVTHGPTETQDNQSAAEVYQAAVESGTLVDLLKAYNVWSWHDLPENPEITGGTVPSGKHSKEFNEIQAAIIAKFDGSKVSPHDVNLTWIQGDDEALLNLAAEHGIQ